MTTPTRRKIDEAWAEAWERKKERERLEQEARDKDIRERMEAIRRVKG